MDVVSLPPLSGALYCRASGSDGLQASFREIILYAVQLLTVLIKILYRETHTV